MANELKEVIASLHRIEGLLRRRSSSGDGRWWRTDRGDLVLGHGTINWDYTEPSSTVIGSESA